MNAKKPTIEFITGDVEDEGGDRNEADEEEESDDEFEPDEDEDDQAKDDDDEDPRGFLDEIDFKRLARKSNPTKNKQCRSTFPLYLPTRHTPQKISMIRKC